MAARRKTLQNSADDYTKIVDVLSRFAIHHTRVSFSCRKVSLLTILFTQALFILLIACGLILDPSLKKSWLSNTFNQHGAARADVHTLASSSKLDAIRSVYGVSVARNLMKVEASDDDPCSSTFEMNGFISNASYNAKKITMVLYVNGLYHRCDLLVEILI